MTFIENKIMDVLGKQILLNQMYFGKHKGQFFRKISKDHLQFSFRGKRYKLQSSYRISSSQKRNLTKVKYISLDYKKLIFVV